ncbi:MAG: class I SAM-dependent methyltransferase [Flavobacteriales bacterium]
MSKQVVYLTNEKPFFSKQYLKVRNLEKRVLSDAAVKELPNISKHHPHYREWQLRQITANRFLNYLENKQSPMNILDIGCGNGWFTHKMAKISSKNNLFGLDINPLELEQSVSVFQKDNLSFYYGDLFEIHNDFNEKFSIITLNASVQYFKDFELLFSKLKTFLLPKGEIHILDSPFYKTKELKAARNRTQEYFTKMGVPEMSNFYYHHTTKIIKDFEILYKPQNKWFQKISLKKESPFLWLRYIKK